MTLTIYGIKNCDTMKKARAWLDHKGAAYAFHDYKAVGIDRARLEAWAGKVGWEILPRRTGKGSRRRRRSP
jgi:arsenate reductase